METSDSFKSFKSERTIVSNTTKDTALAHSLWVLLDFISYIWICAVKGFVFPLLHRVRKLAKFSPLHRYEAQIACVTITARPTIFMPAVTKLPDIIPSHWVRKAQIKPILYWTIFLESGGEICSLLDKKPRRLRYEIRKELHVLKELLLDKLSRCQILKLFSSQFIL